MYCQIQILSPFLRRGRQGLHTPTHRPNKHLERGSLKLLLHFYHLKNDLIFIWNQKNKAFADDFFLGKTHSIIRKDNASL